MPYATAANKTRLYYEEAGSESPVLFILEFAANYASWEPQMRYLSRLHRCIAYLARVSALRDAASRHRRRRG